MKTFNHAVVGCGAIGPHHARSIASIANSKLVAVCDEIPERAKKLADAAGCEMFTDYAKMLERGDIDIVHICVPSGLHAKLGIMAAQAGKHVIVEKPIDVSLEAADALINACRSAGVVLSCISQHRFDPDIAYLKKAVDEGKLGQLNYGCSHTKWYRSQEYYDSGDWRGTWELDGGGALTNQSVHYVDLLQYMMGPVDEVMAYTAIRAHERIEVEDCAAVAVRFKSGALGLLEGNTTAYPGFCTRLDIFGTDGGAIIENDMLREWAVGDERWVRENDKQDLTGASSAEIYSDSHTRQISDVCDAIREGRDPAITGEEGRKPLAILLAVYESARKNAAVKVDG